MTSHHVGANGLNGLRLLVAEDEAMLALSVQRMLEQHGCHVVKVPDVARALGAVARTPFDIALLDLNLRGQWVYPVAKALEWRHMPFIFITGYTAVAIPAAYRGWPVLQKPIAEQTLVQTIAAQFKNR